MSLRTPSAPTLARIPLTPLPTFPRHATGYDTSLFYFDYDTWFFNGTTTAGCPPHHTGVTDLSTNVDGGRSGPAVGLNKCVFSGHSLQNARNHRKRPNSTVPPTPPPSLPPPPPCNSTWACSQANQSAAACPHGYQDDLFISRVEEVIANASKTPDTPLFLFWAPHAPHDPYEVPAAQLAKFAAVDVERRRYYAAMVNYLDGNFARLEAALKAAGRWDNTLIVTSSDNGGPVDAVRGGNNFPLRGGKASNWEGGIRANAFVFGGALDPTLAGTSTDQLTAIEDWWTTFALLGGANTSDPAAAAAGLPPVDGLDLRGLLLPGGNRTSPRRQVVIGDAANEDMAGGSTMVGGVLRADGWKYLVGRVGNPYWQGPLFPNRSTYPEGSLDCGKGCLFNVFTDPHETSEVSAAHPALVAELAAEVARLQATVWSPDRGADDGLACSVAMGAGGGFWGPFLD